MYKIIIILLLFAIKIQAQEVNENLTVPSSVKEVIKLYEGWRSNAYKDSGGENYAVGYGFSTTDKNKVMTKDEGNRKFDKKISKIF